jgi:hypothetical protein
MKKLIAFSFLFALPVLTFAQGVTDADSLIAKINRILNAIIPILISFAVVYLIYAIVKYIIATDEEGRATGKSMIGYGILGLFLILSIWGLVNILVRTFGLNNNVPVNQIPGVIQTDRNIGR